MADLRPAVPGPAVGGRAGLRPAAVQRHPRPADRVPGGAVLRRPDRAARPAAFYPDLGSDAVEGDTRGEESARDQGARRPHPAERRGPRGVRAPHRGLPRPVRHPADRLGPGRGEARPDPEVGLGAHAERADPGARRRRHRGGQDRQPPVRRPGRRRQPDPGRAGGESGGRAAAVRAPAARQAPSAARRPTVCSGSTRMSDAEARATLASCLDVPRWVDEVPAGRPYDSGARGAAPGQGVGRRRSPTTRSPRRWPGTPGSASRPAPVTTPSSPQREQAAVGDADPAVTDAIRAGNAEYESRFDRVFVIRAAGRPADRDPGRTAPPAEQHRGGREGRGDHPAAGDRADPAGNGAGLMGRPTQTGRQTDTLVLQGAHVVTVDGAGSEYADGHVVVTDGRITAGRARAGAARPARAPAYVDATGCLVTPGLGQHPPPPLPVGHPRLAVDDTLFGWLTTLYPVWGRHRRRRRCDAAATGGARLAGRHRLHHDHRPPLRLPARRRRRARAPRSRRPGRSGCGSTRPAARWTSGQSKGGLPPDNVVEDIDAILAATEAAIDTLPRPVVRTRCCGSASRPCSPFSVTGDLLRAGRRAGPRARVCGCTPTSCETLDEEDFCREQFGCTPVDYVESLGWLGPGRLVRPRRPPRRRGDRALAATGTGGGALPDAPTPGSAPASPGSATCATPASPVGLGVDGAASNEAGSLLEEAAARAAVRPGPRRPAGADRPGRAGDGDHGRRPGARPGRRDRLARGRQAGRPRGVAAGHVGAHRHRRPGGRPGARRAAAAGAAAGQRPDRSSSRTGW